LPHPTVIPEKTRSTIYYWAIPLNLSCNFRISFRHNIFSPNMVGKLTIFPNKMNLGDVCSVEKFVEILEK